MPKPVRSFTKTAADPLRVNSVDHQPLEKADRVDPAPTRTSSKRPRENTGSRGQRRRSASRQRVVAAARSPRSLRSPPSPLIPANPDWLPCSAAHPGLESSLSFFIQRHRQSSLSPTRRLWQAGLRRTQRPSSRRLPLDRLKRGRLLQPPPARWQEMWRRLVRPSIADALAGRATGWRRGRGIDERRTRSSTVGDCISGRQLVHEAVPERLNDDDSGPRETPGGRPRSQR